MILKYGWSEQVGIIWLKVNKLTDILFREAIGQLEGLLEEEIPDSDGSPWRICHRENRRNNIST